MDLVELRKNVGMVFQQPTPFPFSVYDNVAYGLRIAGVKDKDLIDQRVEESLKQAAIWKETKDNLNRNAQAFSGGQQQRICIARALIKKPEILIFDDSLSALDTETEENILQNIENDIKSCTSIIITHRESSAKRADHILNLTEIEVEN